MKVTTLQVIVVDMGVMGSSKCNDPIYQSNGIMLSAFNSVIYANRSGSGSAISATIDMVMQHG